MPPRAPWLKMRGFLTYWVGAFSTRVVEIVDPDRPEDPVLGPFSFMQDGKLAQSPLGFLDPWFPRIGLPSNQTWKGVIGMFLMYLTVTSVILLSNVGAIFGFILIAFSLWSTLVYGWAFLPFWIALPFVVSRLAVAALRGLSLLVAKTFIGSFLTVVPGDVASAHLLPLMHEMASSPYYVAILSAEYGDEVEEVEWSLRSWTIDDGPDLPSRALLSMVMPDFRRDRLLSIFSFFFFLTWVVAFLFKMAGRVAKLLKHLAFVAMLFCALIAAFPLDTIFVMGSLFLSVLLEVSRVFVRMLSWISGHSLILDSFDSIFGTGRGRAGLLVVGPFGLVFLGLYIRIFRMLASAGVIETRYSSVPVSVSKTSLRSLWARTLMDITRAVDAFDLPDTIRNLRLKWDVDGVNKSSAILEELGWPQMARVVPGVGPEAFSLPYAEWAAFHFFPAFGMSQAKFFVDRELSDLADLAPLYLRTEEYRTLLNEVKSTSRYFLDKKYDYPDLHADEVFVLVNRIFSNSTLVPFRHIIRKWEKKYALGALWIDSRSGARPRKMSRKHFISVIGSIRAFEALWARTFSVAAELITVNTVSVKGEALPPRKWLSDKVRTVVGAPLPHYIMSTVWNYFQNHNFDWVNTPVKVGMPLNGANMSKLFGRHARFHSVFAGDMSEFDSTISGRVLDIIKAVRKKGFSDHKDFDAISYLIDKTYEQVSSSFLVHNSTATGYRKGTGLSTGHSSTSMDNSLATIILYLLAWKELTGKGAHDFKFFNELSVYGDDHFISTLATAPKVWTFENISRTMARWGVTMRREDPDKGLEHISFLGKRCRRPTAVDIQAFKSAGVPVPEFVIYHEKDRLLGKMLAKVRVLDRDYRIKRLLSYMDLTAHHPDVHSAIRAAIGRISIRSNKNWNIPTYDEILRKWYNEKSLVIDFSDFDTEHEQEMVIEDKTSLMFSYGSRSVGDHLMNFLSHVPDVLNPSIFNQGYIVFFNSLLGSRLSWPTTLLARQNVAFSRAHLGALLNRTCYNFLSDAEHALSSSDSANTTTLLVRHWLFCLFRSGPGNWAWFPMFVDAILRRIAQLAFVLTGEVQEEVRTFNFQFSNTILVALLSFVYVPELPYLGALRIPNLSLVPSRLFGMIFNKFWASVPPSFIELNRTLANDVRVDVDGYKPTLIVAPTGSGKSTALVANIIAELPEFAHFYLIQPRAILVEPLALYLRSAYGIAAGYATHDTGYVPPGKEGLVVCTPAQVFLRQWQGSDCLWLIDEVHVNEPAYRFLLQFSSKARQPALCMTATPTGFVNGMVGKTIHLPMASVYKVTFVKSPDVPREVFISYHAFVGWYRSFVIGIANALPPTAKMLVFVVDKQHGLTLAGGLPGRTCVLSSDSLTVDATCRFFVATSVADAGLTIPNVDHVISANISRCVILRPDATSFNDIVSLPPAIIKQRAGRTGRTNNGFFHLVKVPEGSFTVPEPLLTPAEDTFALIMNSVPVRSIALTQPDGLLRLLFPSAEIKYDREADKLLDMIGDNWDSFRKVVGNNLTFGENFKINVAGQEWSAGNISVNAYGDFTFPQYEAPHSPSIAALNMAARASLLGHKVTVQAARALLYYAQVGADDNPFNGMGTDEFSSFVERMSSYIRSRTAESFGQDGAAPATYFFEDPTVLTGLGNVSGVENPLDQPEFDGSDGEGDYEYDSDEGYSSEE